MSDKTRVLVVDDELDTLNLLKLLLEVSGFDPITTLNSVEALQLAELEAPDVILLDIMMPKLDGFALCKMMRQHPEIKNRPIIFVTAYEALDLEERKDDAGADAVVPKPIDMNKLTETIEEVRQNRAKSKVEQLTAAVENNKPPVPEPQITKEAENVKPEVKADGKTTQTAKKVESRAADQPVVMKPPEPRQMKPQAVEKKDDERNEGK